MNWSKSSISFFFNLVYGLVYSYSEQQVTSSLCCLYESLFCVACVCLCVCVLMCNEEEEEEEEEGGKKRGGERPAATLKERRRKKRKRRIVRSCSSHMI